eukprot:5291-Amorphochlora_amoeboformis.AAC.1
MNTLQLAAIIGGVSSVLAYNAESLGFAPLGSRLLFVGVFFAAMLLGLLWEPLGLDDTFKGPPKENNFKPRQLYPEVDGRDKGTPDNWVGRHPSLVRLTGRHPFNCEPPLKDLMDAGFITPSNQIDMHAFQTCQHLQYFRLGWVYLHVQAPLHFVRNHGKVPKINWNDHKITVTGLVNKPCTFTMDELVAMPSHELPITFPCAGNRRKEENMVKKGLGFSWGPAAHATSVWKGVRLSTVLKHCGIKTPAEGAKFVCFRGPKKELPKGADGSYGTSIAYNRAMEKQWDVLIAYEQNGKPLAPDHGFPVRMLIPGFIGGRMVKWLSHIEVTSHESKNHFHYYDNRVLPSHVTADIANEEDWWHNPDFIINDINVQSAIRSPEHKEIVLDDGGKYTVKGYGYCGGGKKIIRCEVSLDIGVTWKPCKITRHEREWYKKNSRTDYENFDSRGKHWCWVFWQIDLEKKDLCAAPEIRCRAWDQDHNTQPLHIAWNVMGMLNNSSYRLVIHETKDSKDNKGVWFEHPTLPGPQPGGWMVPEADVRKQAIYASLGGVDPRNVPERKFSTSEITSANEEGKGVLLAIDGVVFDASSVLSEVPPNGFEVTVGGTSWGQDFAGLKDADAKKLLAKFQGGKLKCLGVYSA